MSGDARFVTFDTASDFFDPNETSDQILDVYCRDEPISLTSRLTFTADGREPNGHCDEGEISGDGRYLAFSSSASDMLPIFLFSDEIYLLQRRLDEAYWKSYGEGYAGTNGIPALGMSADPVLHQDVALEFDNSSGRWSVALVLLGDVAVQWPTGFGGDLLVDPLLSILVPLPPTGGVLRGVVPPDGSLVGLVLYAQALEVDPGASDGISFTPGVELGLGL
jgi:hypothetical protein